jgi:hypothetical protein
LPNYDQAKHEEMAEMMEEAYRTRKYTTSAGGFEHPYHKDADNDPYFRGFVMHFGHLGFPVRHAYYKLMATDCEGNLLTGKKLSL